ncbi:helix-turn-helix domain-containing protein [Paraburkholderia sp. UCT70]|uniref:helix-turn-helix domain-containing protein n=1 Tax=Paraburkholderia sp. UCT70 TaxID=2991068 RepID=UPI003D1A7D9B
MKIIEAVVQHRLTIVLAAERLQLCERQVSRLVRRYESAGPGGLVSAQRGQPSNRELPVDVRSRAMALVRERYADFGPTLYDQSDPRSTLSPGGATATDFAAAEYLRFYATEPREKSESMKVWYPTRCTSF